MRARWHQLICMGRYEDERNDCTVRALSVTTGAAYADAHALLKAAGRREGRGFELITWLDSHTRGGQPVYLLGCKVTRELSEWAGHKPTVAQALHRFRRGRYVFVTKDHAFAVVDGTQIDLFETRARTRVWRVYRVDRCPRPAGSAVTLDAGTPGGGMKAGRRNERISVSGVGVPVERLPRRGRCAASRLGRNRTNSGPHGGEVMLTLVKWRGKTVVLGRNQAMKMMLAKADGREQEPEQGADGQQQEQGAGAAA